MIDGVVGACDYHRVSNCSMNDVIIDHHVAGEEDTYGCVVAVVEAAILNAGSIRPYLPSSIKESKSKSWIKVFSVSQLATSTELHTLKLCRTKVSTIVAYKDSTTKRFFVCKVWLSILNPDPSSQESNLSTVIKLS